MDVENPEPVVNTNLVVHMEETHAAIQPDTLLDSQQPTKKRAGRIRSKVWDHFTILVEGPDRRAVCNRCKKSYTYSKGSKVSGTSHLKRHAEKATCKLVLGPSPDNNYNLSVINNNDDVNKDSNGKEVNKCQPRRRVPPFDEYHSRRQISKMIIMHDYPLHMVEHPGFIAFVRNLQPRFEMVSFETVQRDVVETYLQEKYRVQKLIEDRLPGRICLTLDVWSSSSSSRNVGYVFVSGQFVGSDWRMCRKLLNVVMVPFPDSDTALCHSVSTCLSDWGITREMLFSVTVNQGLTGAAADNLKAMVDGQFLVGNNCLARTLSNIVRVPFSAFCVAKVRNMVKYLNPAMGLVVDDQSQWNTTYEMLLSACELKASLHTYENAPSAQEWKQVETICALLKPLYGIGNLFRKTPAAPNMFFQEIWNIQYELACVTQVDDDDPWVNDLKKSMQVNFDNYWKSVCYVLAFGVVMDPRYKMIIVKYSFSKSYEHKEADSYLKIVNDWLHEMFRQYEGPPPDEAVEGDHGMVSEFDVYVMEVARRVEKSELDQYLEESLLPREQEFDILGWWEVNRVRYPTLSRMARDVLSIPVCSVPCESVFDMVGKEMDSYRCTLPAKTVEAVICAKDWLQN